MPSTENTATIATLLGAGPATIDTVTDLSERAAILVAVDGGARHAVRAGLRPDLIIGDFDSIPQDLPASFASVERRHIGDQDSTDFDKALRSVEADLCLCAGFLDGRADHTLGCFHTLLSRPERRAILVSETDAVMLLPRQLRMALPLATRVSVFPLRASRLASAGLRWALDGLDLQPGVAVSTSNETSLSEFQVTSDSPGSLLILPAAHLDQLIAAAQSSPVWTGD